MTWCPCNCFRGFAAQRFVSIGRSRIPLHGTPSLIVFKVVLLR